MKKSEFITIWLQYDLHKKEIEDALCHTLGITPKEFFHMDDIDAEHLYELQKLFCELSQGKPQEYVYKKAEFWSNPFFVDERVLIPRNDTEVLVDEAIKTISTSGNTDTSTYMDIGTGSWCVAVSILKAISPLSFVSAYAVDNSPQALEVAKINRDTHNLTERLTLVEWSLLEPFIAPNTYEIAPSLYITANLPYIRDNDTQNTAESVRKFEPKNALYGGEKTGFELYETLIKQCFQLKNIAQLKSIDLFIEIGFDQYEVSKNFLQELGLRFEYFSDTHKISRVIHISSF